MHELSIALSIIEGAEEELRRRGGSRVSAVHLKLGLLSGVVQEALQFSYELVCAGTLLEGSKLIIEEIPIRIYCSACNVEGEPVSLQHLHCASCGAPLSRVIQGTELELTALELLA